MAAKKSESNSFLAEVIADPDNDIPRLIYADWLEEQGSPRGEFIRVQCELNQISDLDPRWLDLQFRSNELLEKHGEQWAKEIGQDVRKCVYTRGFIETITILARTLQKDGNKLFQSFPVRWIRLNYLKGTADEWKDCTALQHVQYLDLKDLKIPDEDLAAILNSPHLRNLKGLKIGGGGQVTSDRVALAVSAPRIASQLEFLEVSAYEEHSIPLLNAFRNSIGLPRLKQLHLGAVSEQFPEISKRAFCTTSTSALSLLRLCIDSHTGTLKICRPSTSLIWRREHFIRFSIRRSLSPPNPSPLPTVR